jgi:hypothetical protein
MKIVPLSSPYRHWVPVLALMLAGCPTPPRRAVAPIHQARSGAQEQAKAPTEALRAGSSPAAGRESELTLVGAWRLRCSDRRFGGLSGLWVDVAKRELTALSDRGHWLTAPATFDRDGRLASLGPWTFAPLLDRERKPLSGLNADAEALTREPDGRWLVAFEHWHRIWRYPPAGPSAGPPRAISSGLDLRAAAPNGGIEALVALDDGRLLALSERMWVRDGTAVRGWLHAAGAWHALDYQVSALFLPTDAARLPSGDVVVLERRYLGATRLAARLRWVPARAIQPGALIRPRLLARIAEPTLLDNYEGLATTAHGDHVDLFIISDDNFSAQQRTLLLQLRRDSKASGSRPSGLRGHAPALVELDTCPR